MPADCPDRVSIFAHEFQKNVSRCLRHARYIDPKKVNCLILANNGEILGGTNLDLVDVSSLSPARVSEFWW